jgi:high-affinity Fe2+/Pb2+ permease
MALPAILQGDSPTRLLQGAAAGAVAALVIGFYWGGWVTGGTAKEMVQKSVSVALVSALAPICVDKFQHSADAAANLVEFKKVSSWQQGSFIEKGGWATMPDGQPANAAVAQACATMLSSLQK